MTDSLLFLFQRDLNLLKAELNQFTDEADLWEVRGDIINPAGNLAYHLAGNLQHFFGAVMGNTGYQRDREAEFGAKNIPRTHLLQEIENAETAVKGVLEHISADALQADYPVQLQNKTWTVECFFLMLYGHLNYHLGQVNYLRRMINENGEG